MAEFTYRSTQGALSREGPDVQLVDDRFLPSAAASAVVEPDMRHQVEHHAEVKIELDKLSDLPARMRFQKSFLEHENVNHMSLVQTALSGF